MIQVRIESATSFDRIEIFSYFGDMLSFDGESDLAMISRAYNAWNKL